MVGENDMDPLGIALPFGKTPLPRMELIRKQVIGQIHFSQDA